MKNRQCDDNKNEYAKQLQQTNELQNLHYQVMFDGAYLIVLIYYAFFP